MLNLAIEYPADSQRFQAIVEREACVADTRCVMA